jgi:hypothetical protein
MMYLALPNSFRLARYLAPAARTLSDPAKIAKTAGVDNQKLDEAFEYVQNTSRHGGLLVVRHVLDEHSNVSALFHKSA